MAAAADEKSSIIKNVGDNLLRTIIPALSTLFILYISSIFVPRNEVRFLPAQIDGKNLYMSIENHGSAVGGPLSFSVVGSLNLKVISKSDYIDVEIKENEQGYAILKISSILPSQRTTIILHNDTPIVGSNFSLLSGAANTAVISPLG